MVWGIFLCGMQTLSCCTWNPLARDWTQAAWIESVETQPQAHQGSPRSTGVHCLTASLNLRNSQVCTCGNACSVASVMSASATPWTISPPGSFVYGILQAVVLERVAIYSSRGPSPPRGWTCVSCGCCVGRRILYHWATTLPSIRSTKFHKWMGVEADDFKIK